MLANERLCVNVLCVPLMAFRMLSYDAEFRELLSEMSLFCVWL